MRRISLLHHSVALILVTASLVACAVAPAQPQPGAKLSGKITMDAAKSASLTLRVSDDGQMLESVSLAFTELKCEGFSAGSTSMMASGQAPIPGGKFEFKSSNFGEISGQFSSPTAARGTIHLLFFDGGVDCGTWN